MRVAPEFQPVLVDAMYTRVYIARGCMLFARGRGAHPGVQRLLVGVMCTRVHID